MKTSQLIAPIALALATLTPSLVQAETIIKQPGAHPHYAFELEPHLLLAVDNPYWGNDGWGLGLRAAVPIMHQGPISKINNNMAIGFGLDWASYGHCNDGYYGAHVDKYGLNWNGRDCSVNAVHVPVVLQWNFYITDIITAFGEPGFGVRHTWVSGDYPCGNGNVCRDSNSYTDLVPYFSVGAKFMFGRAAGLMVRVGYPTTTVGGVFQF